jgi:alpha-tubulin suppressor-like RCC1 family protein
MTIHSKFHRKNHHTDTDPFNPDAGHDPIASKDAPFRGNFHLNGSLTATGILSAKNIYVRDTLNLDSVFFNTLTANKIYLTSQITLCANSTQPTLLLSQAGAGDALHVYDEVNEKTPFIIDTQGKIGAGTFKPDAAITLSSFNTIGAIHIIQVDNSGYALRVEDSAGDTTPFLIDKNGNVCIKTNTPATDASLTVNGAISGNATLSLNGFTYNNQQNLLSPKNFYLGGSQGASPVYLTLGYTRTANGDSEIDLYTDTTAGSNPNGKIVRRTGVNGNFEFTNRGTGLLSLSSAGSVSLQSINGNVGIGTTTPTAKTEIYSNNSTGALKITQVNTSGYSFRVDDSAGDTTPFLIDNNGNVCIKTNTPAANASLTVNGAISGNATLSLNGFTYNNQQNLLSPKNFYLGGSQGASPVYLTLGYNRQYSGSSEIDFYTDNTNSATPNAYIKRNLYTNGNFDIINNGTGTLNLTNSSGNIVLTSSTTGGVGIGTSTPEAELHIYSNDPVGCLRVTQLNDNGYAFRVDDSANDTTPFLIDNNGNVGIKTTLPASPTNSLTVNGTLSANYLIGDGSQIINIKSERLFSSFLDTSNYTGSGLYDDSSFYVTKTGKLYYAGSNNYGFGQGSNITLGRNGFRESQITLDSDNEFVVKAFSCTYSMYVLTNLGNLYSTGNNNYGQLGIGNTTNSGIWNKINISNVVNFSVSNGANSGGYSHCLAVNSSGQLFGWGYNKYGQLGLNNNSTAYYSTPTRINLGAIANKSILNVFACSTDSGDVGFSYVTDTQNNVYATGYNLQGQFGLNNTVNYNVFTALGIQATKILAKAGSPSRKQDGFAAISAFYFNKNDGSLKSCGDNNYGQLGIGDKTDYKVFKNVFSSGVSDITVSGDACSTVLVLMNDKTIRTWGANLMGECGSSSQSNIISPYTPSGISNVVKIMSVGSARCSNYLIDSSGYLWGAGYNLFGQLGNGNTNLTTKFSRAIQSNGINFVDMIGICANQVSPNQNNTIETGINSIGLLAATDKSELYYIGLNSSGEGGVMDYGANNIITVIQKSNLI